MFHQLKEIIAKIPSEALIYLSNFTPETVLNELLERNFALKLLPCTLQGLIDTKVMKPFDKNRAVHIIYWPFFHNLSSATALESMQSTHHFKLHTIKPSLLHNFQEIQTTFKEALTNSKDLDLGDITTAKEFIIYLRPHMFCPKEDILLALKDRGINFNAKISALYQHPYFESEKQDHMTAHECCLSFIALDCDISQEEALINSAAILDVLESHALRRCSF